MYLRHRIWFYKWALVVIGLAVSLGTLGFLALPANLHKLDLYRGDPTAVNAVPYYDYNPPGQ